MTLKLENVLSEVLKRTIPNRIDRERVQATAKKLQKKLKQVTRKANLKVKISVDGSVAKNTWLRESPDIDIFMCVPTTVPKEDFGTIYLDIAKKATAGYKQVERFAEHPYLEAISDGIRVNIVPCYHVEKGKWKSATDRTPFHTLYLKSLLNEQLCNEVRLLKRFMQGISVYGAEIKVGGFSGFICELLVVFYGSFVKVLESSSSWMTQTIIDLEKHYENQKNAIKLRFQNPLVVVDPIDIRRNAASAVRPQQLFEFISASRAFLNSPSKRFFYPPETEALSQEKMLQMLRKRGSSIIFLKFGKVDAVPDILWGQLYKSQRALRKIIKQHDFEILRDAAWSNEKNLNMFLLEVKHQHLPFLRKHLGPPIEKKQACENFLEKHINSKHTLSGPRIEGDRWVVETKRKHSDLIELLRTSLKGGGRGTGIAELVSQAIAKDLDILVNEEVRPVYLDNPDFAKFLTEYIEGLPKWLD